MKKKADIKLIIAFFMFIVILSTLLIGKQIFSLENVRDSLAYLKVHYEEHVVLFVLLYMILYVFISVLGIPAAAVLTLLAGAIFGFTVGTVVASFASSLGATCSFLLSRYLLRDWVTRRFGARLQKIQEGIQHDGAYYLFTLRLVLIFPFFVINAVMGLTSMKAWTFHWVSQLGMLAGTMVYVNAGKQLAQLTSLEGILSWKILLSFALIGLFPILTKKTFGCIRRQRSE